MTYEANKAIVESREILSSIERVFADIWDSTKHALKVASQTQGYVSSVTITRPNDTNIYAAKDAIGSATAAGGAVLTFANIGRIGEMLITSVAIEIDVTAIPAGMTSFDLHLYSVTPPSDLGDNGAWDLAVADRASYLGKIILGTPVDEVSTLYVEQHSNPGVNLPKQVTLASTSLFAYLVTVGGYTPTALAVKKITLHAIEA